MKLFYSILCLFLGLSIVSAQAQPKPKKEKQLIQLSGVVKADEKTPIPFTLVRIRNTSRGTIAGVDGYYSLAVGERDTVEYDAVNFKKDRFIVPSNLPEHKFTKNIILASDTVAYEATVPWATEAEFKQAFLSLKLSDRPEDNAKKNLDQEKLMELYETLARDGKENQLYTLQTIASSYYYAGGQHNYAMLGGTPVPTSLLNPFAWVKFIDALKKGRLKKKTEKRE